MSDKHLGVNLEHQVSQSRQIKNLKKELGRLQSALRSIANNTCCGSCQEAALVARKALHHE